MSELTASERDFWFVVRLWNVGQLANYSKHILDEIDFARNLKKWLHLQN